MVDCWAIHHPPLDFHGTGGRGRCHWRCQQAPSSRTGADGPQAEEYTMAADANRIAPVPCDEKGYFVFLDKALKKNMVCPVVIKSPAKFCTWGFYSNSLKFCQTGDFVARIPGYTVQNDHFLSV